MPALIALLQEESANHATFDLLVSGLGFSPTRAARAWCGLAVMVGRQWVI